MRLLLAVALTLAAHHGAAAPAASGRHWLLSVGGLNCDGQVLSLRALVTYAGPAGAAEAPVSRLVDGEGRAHVPRGLVWQSGSKLLAAWLSKGGLANMKANEQAQLLFRFQPGESTTGFKLEFGDIPAFTVTRSGKTACEGLLKPSQIQVPRRPRAEPGKATLRFYRDAYPCQPATGGEWRRVEAPNPPYLPEQLLVFGRGHLPAARQIDLPMGKAPAQGYAYSGPEELPDIEAAARKALAADFPAYRASAKHFAFNWGLQRTPSGNELYSVGVYPIRTCGR